MSENTTAKKTGVDKLIDGIEKVCNKLPPPAILFCCLFLITAIIGCIFSVMGVAITNPGFRRGRNICEPVLQRRR